MNEQNYSRNKWGEPSKLLGGVAVLFVVLLVLLVGLINYLSSVK